MTQSNESTESICSTTQDREGKYLTFTLADEEYGIGILKIKEIIGMMPITSVPQTPDYVKGVINLRGKVIPVTDLRLRFAMAVGIVVDAVSEVMNIKAEEIEDTPSFGTKVATDYILGMANMEGMVKILLDIDGVLTSEAVAALEQAA